MATPARRCRAVGAQLGQPPVVGPGPGQQQLAGHVAGGAEAGAERGGRAAGHRVGVGEDDLAGHAVGVELLVAAARRPSRRAGPRRSRAPTPRRTPRCAARARPARPPSRRAPARYSSKASPVLRVEPVAVLLVGQAGVAVGRDHQVAVHACASSRSARSAWTVGRDSSASSIESARAWIWASIGSLGRQDPEVAGPDRVAPPGRRPRSARCSGPRSPAAAICASMSSMVG